MTTEAWVTLAILVVVGILAASLAIYLLVVILRGAISLFCMAIRKEFPGFVAYVLAWVLLFPLMLILSLVVGVIETALDPERSRGSST